MIIGATSRRNRPPQNAGRPVDPGWPFLLAGLAILAASMLVPAAADAQQAQRCVRHLRQQETAAIARIEAATRFLRQLDEPDPALLRRLAAAQLNLVPAGSQPLLVTADRTASIDPWIEAAVPEVPAPARLPVPSLLGRLADGKHRPWFLAVGAICVMSGLVFDGRPARRPARAATSVAISRPRRRRRYEPLLTLVTPAEPQPDLAWMALAPA